MKQKIYFLLMIPAILFSCKKNNDSLQLAGQYKTNTSGSIGPVMMYTSTGQVTDIAAIKSFLKSRGIEDVFTFNSHIFALTANDFLQLTISQNNTVSVQTNFSPEPKQAEIISQTSSQFMVAFIDSAQILMPSSGDRCETLHSAIKKVDPPKQYYIIPPSTGYRSFYKFRPTFPIEIENGQLFLPLTTFMVSTVDPTNPIFGFFCVSWFNNERNTFNPDVIKLLHAGDTIAYQAKKVKLLR